MSSRTSKDKPRSFRGACRLRPGHNQPMPVLRPIAQAAYITGRHRTLIHQWIRAGLIPAACDTRTHETLVDLGEVARLSKQKPRRAPRSLTSAAA